MTLHNIPQTENFSQAGLHYVTYVKVALSNGTKTINYFPYCKASDHRAKIIGQVFHLKVVNANIPLPNSSNKVDGIPHACCPINVQFTRESRCTQSRSMVMILWRRGGSKPSAFRTLNSHIAPLFLGFLPWYVFRFQNIKTVLLSSFPYFSQFPSF